MVQIIDSASGMVALAVLRDGSDIEAQFGGLCRGEKLVEVLLTAHEQLMAADHPKIVLRPVLPEAPVVRQELDRQTAGVAGQDHAAGPRSLVCSIGDGRRCRLRPRQSLRSQNSGRPRT
jgi:FlaA1/EpsC-like NDP-sugar epimerase